MGRHWAEVCPDLLGPSQTRENSSVGPTLRPGGVDQTSSPNRGSERLSNGTCVPTINCLNKRHKVFVTHLDETGL